MVTSELRLCRTESEMKACLRSLAAWKDGRWIVMMGYEPTMKDRMMRDQSGRRTRHDEQ